MGDAGEGLVDAEARIQERMEELEAERRRRAGGAAKIDPEKLRQSESLKLARINLQKQAEAATHPVRKQQIELAIGEIDKRLQELV
jgi:chaperonin cofactor prefoldin